MTIKSFNGAPFGFQSHRFDLAGVHPKRKVPGTFIGLQSSDSNIGPGYYYIEDKNSSFSPAKLEMEAKKPGWKRSYALEQFSSMPYIMNSELYLSKEEQKRKLGPGYYSLDSNPFNLKKSMKGIMSYGEPRFMKDFKENTPGPGAYGKSGIPHLLKEEQDHLRRSPSLIGILSNGGKGERSLPLTGCRLASNTYILPSFADEIINHKVGKRGPYDVFSLNRSKPIKTGHLAINPAHELAPGHYNFNSSIDLLNCRDHRYYGKFLKSQQYPEKPYDRAYWNNPAHVPPDVNNQMAPGKYDIHFPDHRIVHNQPPPFNMSSHRTDKISNMFFTQNFNQVGPGRYDLQGLTDSKYVNSHENVFNSKTEAHHSKEKSSIMSERLRAINIPSHKKTIIDHYSTEIAPCVNNDQIPSQHQRPLKLM